ncbi:MAG: site-specific integrase [Bacteroidales bacterium]|nr:site-specific integrase [Bacteroidales bacterium]
MEKRTTFSLLFFIKRTKILKTGEAPIYMRITVKGKRADIALNRSVDPNIWSTEKGACRGTSKEARSINMLIESIKTQIHQNVIYMREDNKPICVESIKNSYLGLDTEEEDKGKKILELYREHNEKIKTLKNIDFAPATVQRYETSLRFTQDFIKRKYKKDDLYLSELNHQFMVDYEIYFKTVRKCAHNTTMKYLKNFKKIVRLAINHGYIDKDPFVNYKMKLKKVDRGFLSEEELDIIMKKEISNKRLEQIRDCFVFSCFTGLAYSDLKRLSGDHIVTGTDGGRWIKIKRMKTDNMSSIPILPISQKIIDKYKNDTYCKANNVLLPVRSNQKMNNYLHELANICEIEKNLTSHLARHTFATTVTLNNNVPIETVSKMLGHSSINMTKIYARLLDKKVGQDMKHLNDKYANVNI